MLNFTTITSAQIAEYLVKHQADLDAEGIEAADVTDGIATGRVLLECRSYGFALLEIEHGRDGVIPFLWALFIDREQRGQGLGRKFMKELLQKYSADYHMSLKCFGPSRRRFFGRCGFRVERRDGDMRRMTTNTAA